MNVRMNNSGLISRQLCAEFDPEGIAANVDGFSTPNADIMKQIKEEEEKRILEEKKNAAKIQLQKDSFDQEYEVIRNRRDKAKFNANNNATKARTADNELYQAGGVDTETHKKNLEKILDDCRKECEKADSEYQKAYNNLRTKNPEGYRRSDRY